MYSVFEPLKRFRFLIEVEYSIGSSPIPPAIHQLSDRNYHKVDRRGGNKLMSHNCPTDEPRAMLLLLALRLLRLRFAK
jgi:hypothetical protein